MVVVRLVDNPAKVSLPHGGSLQRSQRPSEQRPNFESIPTDTHLRPGIKVHLPRKDIRNKKLEHYFKNLTNLCLKTTFDRYVYDVCLFANVTQADYSSSLLASSTTLLGTWQEFVLNDDDIPKIIGLNYFAGDGCPGNVCREVKVMLSCGFENKLISVREPSPCNYEIILETPAFCSMPSVYSLLPKAVRKKWDRVASLHVSNMLTSHGLRQEIRHLLIGSGVLLHPKDVPKIRTACFAKEQNNV